MAEEETPATGAQSATDTEGQDNGDDILAGARNPDAVKAAIDRQKQAARDAKREADELRARLQQYEDGTKSEQQRLEERATSAEGRAEAAELRALRFEVAAAKRVPFSQAHRLQGATKDELEADADAFMRDYKPSTGGGKLDGGPRQTADKPKDMDSMIRSAAGRT